MAGMAASAGAHAKKLYEAGKPLAQKAVNYAAANPGKAAAGAAVAGGMTGYALGKRKDKSNS